MVLDQSKILYCDTDSVMFIQRKGETMPLTTGNYLGDLTDELPENVVVTGYYCGGPKFYLLTGKNTVTGEPYSVYKIKGVSLNLSNSTAVNPENIKKLVMMADTPSTIAASHDTISRVRKTGKLVNKHCFKLCRATNFKRIFNVHTGLSYPFGYNIDG